MCNLEVPTAQNDNCKAAARLPTAPHCQRGSGLKVKALQACKQVKNMQKHEAEVFKMDSCSANLEAARHAWFQQQEDDHCIPTENLRSAQRTQELGTRNVRSPRSGVALAFCPHAAVDSCITFGWSLLHFELSWSLVSEVLEPKRYARSFLELVETKRL